MLNINNSRRQSHPPKVNRQSSLSKGKHKVGALIQNQRKKVKAKTSKSPLVQHIDEMKHEDPETYAAKLRDFGLFLEYKKLAENYPSGVYVMPSFDDMRIWFGVIFIRASYYRNGIFKFTILIPDGYPEQPPRIYFYTKVNNPLVNPKTGKLDISSRVKDWNKPDSKQCNIISLLEFLKQIFYKPSLWTLSDPPANPEALKLFQTDPEKFMDECVASSESSINAVYNNQKDSSLIFKESHKGHQIVLDRILSGTSSSPNSNSSSGSSAGLEHSNNSSSAPPSSHLSRQSSRDQKDQRQLQSSAPSKYSSWFTDGVNSIAKWDTPTGS